MKKPTDSIAGSRPTRNLRILAMDDDPSVLRILNMMLIEMGFDVATVDDGAKAFELYQSGISTGSHFHAAILDLAMLRGDGGVATARRILEIHPDARLIASSGHFDSDVRMDCQQAGFVGIVEKPYAVMELKKALSLLAGS